MKLSGQVRWCILDSGSEVSVVPARLIKNELMRPSTQKLNAANGSEIKISGEVILELQLDDHSIPAKCLVTESIDEILLGLNWLEDNEVVWDFQKRTVMLNGKRYVLQSQDPPTNVRRITVQDNTIVPPRCHKIIKAKTIYKCLPQESDDLITKATEIVPGVRLARTLVADKPFDINVEVMNLSSAEVHLPKGLELGQLEEVNMSTIRKIDSEEITTNESSVDFVTLALETVEPTMPLEAKVGLQVLLENYADIFSKSEYDLGCATAVKHRIDTGNERPIRQPLRRQPTHLTRVIDEQLKLMQEQNIITPCQSEWSSNIVLVKKDGSTRFCVDYRQLNDKTVKDCYPLPRIDDCLDALGGSKWFTTVDLRSGYHQVAMDDRDLQKTSFVTRRGTFAFKVMPFGLCNAPATFQRLMDHTMIGLNYEICLVYLDDIIVFSKDIPTHLERLETLFSRLRQANLKLKPSKCHFLQSSVEFLGYIITQNGISTDPKKIEAVVNWPTPKNLREVRSFVGLCGYYRRFVDNFSETAAPLYALTKKNARFDWNLTCQISFEKLKSSLVNAPVLGLPGDEGLLILDTDASEHGIGAILSQMQDDSERVLVYASRL